MEECVWVCIFVEYAVICLWINNHFKINSITFDAMALTYTTQKMGVEYKNWSDKYTRYLFVWVWLCIQVRVNRFLDKVCWKKMLRLRSIPESFFRDSSIKICRANFAEVLIFYFIQHQGVCLIHFWRMDSNRFSQWLLFIWIFLPLFRPLLYFTFP